MWEHVTAGDKKLTLPPTPVLFRLHDPRAVQFWDDERALSRLMVQDLPGDTLNSVAEADSGRAAIAWDCIALYGSGRRRVATRRCLRSMSTSYPIDLNTS